MIYIDASHNLIDASNNRIAKINSSTTMKNIKDTEKDFVQKFVGHSVHEAYRYLFNDDPEKLGQRSY